MIVLAFILTTIGTWLLNHSGGLTASKKHRIVGLTLNIVALVLFANTYGNARGTFIYLGVWAFIGMVIAFALPYFEQKKAS